jgi:undecaprenyl-diphosphatase
MEAIFNFLAEHFDLPILDWIAAHLHCAFLDAVMPVITALANAGIFWIALTVLLLALPKHRRTGIAMSLSLIMGLIVCNLILKPAFARIRPYDYQLAHYGKVIPLLINAMHDYSFPSGHTMASFEAATALALGNKKLGIPALILASLIAFSRLYLYVHYPTDVLFSIAMGIAFGFIAHHLAKKIPFKNH